MSRTYYPGYDESDDIETSDKINTEEIHSDSDGINTTSIDSITSAKDKTMDGSPSLLFGMENESPNFSCTDDMCSVQDYILRKSKKKNALLDSTTSQGSGDHDFMQRSRSQHRNSINLLCCSRFRRNLINIFYLVIKLLYDRFFVLHNT